MKNKSTPLVDELLQSLQGIQQVDTDDFFYTRLKAKMEKNIAGEVWDFPLKPIWVVSAMVLLLAINIYILSQQQTSKVTITSNTASLQNFARAYDQVTPSF